MVYRPESFEEFLASGYLEGRDQEQEPLDGEERERAWDAWVDSVRDEESGRPVVAEPQGRLEGAGGGRGYGRPLEREIRVLEDGIARLGVMLENGQADARDVALPLARLVRALSMALRTQ